MNESNNIERATATYKICCSIIRLKFSFQSTDDDDDGQNHIPGDNPDDD